MTAHCIPVSWLRIERYALGELGADERAEIGGHLATCPRCRACADRIGSDAQVELPPLPATAATPVAAAATARHHWFGRPSALAFAAAAALFAFAVIRPRDQPRVGDSRVGDSRGAGPRIVAVKGGDVTLELVRERDGSAAWEPTSFAPSDRFKLLLTCPPPLRLHADFVVLQGDGPAFPGAPAFIACGNRVPLPTAFRITGSGAATICVAIDPSAPPSRAGLANGRESELGAHACLHLDRAE